MDMRQWVDGVENRDLAMDSRPDSSLLSGGGDRGVGVGDGRVGMGRVGGSNGLGGWGVLFSSHKES